MKNALQTLEPRVLLAAVGDEVLKFKHSEAFCGTSPGEDFAQGMMVHYIDETYYSSGELKRCVGSLCMNYQGTVDIAYSQTGVVLKYVGIKGRDGRTYETTIHVATSSANGSMVNCDQSPESKQCDSIVGEVELSKK